MGCGQANQKLLVVEMAIEIRLLFFNGPNFFSSCFSTQVARFWLLDHGQGVD
jgi:hypothetical protein